VIVGLLARTYTATPSLLKVSAVVLATGISIIVVAAIWPGMPYPIPSILALGALGSLVFLTGVRALALNSPRGFV